MLTHVFFSCAYWIKVHLLLPAADSRLITLIFILTGDDSSEASAALKYNRLKNTVSAEVVIPDYDVEAGVKLVLTESGAERKMRGITVDITNKNIPQLTLVGRARYRVH